MHKKLERRRVQKQARVEGLEVPEALDLPLVPVLYKPTPAGQAKAARVLGESPKPEEELGIPVPGVEGHRPEVVPHRVPQVVDAAQAPVESPERKAPPKPEDKPKEAKEAKEAKPKGRASVASKTPIADKKP